MWGLACSAPGLTHVVRQQGPAASTGRPASTPASTSGTCPPARRQRRRGAGAGSRRTSSSSTAASALDEAAAAAATSSSGGGDAGPADIAAATAEYLQHCQQHYGKQGLIEFSAGAGGLPKATLQHPGGARAELYLHGAAVTSWQHSDGREMLHVREGNAFDGQEPISGGIQLAWPQYGVGPLPTNGFLQHLHWSVVDTAWRQPDMEAVAAQQAAEGPEGSGSVDLASMVDWRPTISLYADTDEEWAKEWPHKFEALYSVTLMQPDPEQPSELEVLRQAAERYQPWVKRQQQEQQLLDSQPAVAPQGRPGWGGGVTQAQHQQRQRDQRLEELAHEQQAKHAAAPSVLRCLLQVHNSDDKPLTFTAGLRTHFATQDIPSHAKFVKTLGLKGKYTLDYSGNPLKPRLGVEDAHSVHFGDMAPQDKLFVDCDAQGDVFFCPGSSAHFQVLNKQGFSDIGVQHPASVAPREARGFVTLASARAVRKVELQPGEIWIGEMIVTAHDRYWDLPAWELDDPAGVPIPSELADALLPRRPSTFMLDED